MMRLVLTLFFFLFVTLSSHQAVSAPKDSHPCFKMLTCLSSPSSCEVHKDLPNIRIHSSGQDHDMQKKVQRAAYNLYIEVARKLGLKIPDSEIRHATASEMAAITGVGGHPAPHWYDGAQVIAGSLSASGILEVVFPGMYRHHQYVRDTNTLHETLLVYAHVAGHYDYAENTPLDKVRNLTVVESSLELANYMTELKTKVPYHVLSQWYHWLQSLGTIQDMTRGSYQSVEELGNSSDSTKASPKAPTDSVLQAFVANLPHDVEPWKHRMGRLFEKVQRILPSYATTKIMNEGWSVMTEFLVLRHSEWNRSTDAQKFALTNSGVAYPDFGNPYWLGYEAWNRVRERFNEKPENAALSELERDKAFVAYAQKLIRGHTDYSFLRMALDARWVEKMKLVLYRPEEEFDMSTWQMVEQKRAITRDPKRIIDYISRIQADKELYIPKIQLTHFNENNTGTIVLKHNEVFGIPLRRETMAKTLYVLANIMKRPVKMKTIWSSLWSWQFGGDLPPVFGWNWEVTLNGSDKITHGDLEVTVTPDGKVRINSPDTISKDFKDSLEEQLQVGLKEYIEDAALSYEAELSAKTSLPLKTFMATNADNPQVYETTAHLMAHAPTAAEAVLDYKNMVEVRRAQALQAILKGKTNPIFQGGRVYFRVLPETPQFQLDTAVYGRRSDHKKYNDPTPVDKFGFLQKLTDAPKTKETPFIPDEDLDIIQHPAQPGDIFHRRPKPPPQPGEGDGNEPSEDPTKPGGGKGGDPNYESIPLEVYADLLAQEVELRNLRRTKGKNEVMDDIREGSIRRPFGEIKWDRTAQVAYGLGKALDLKKRREAKAKGLPPPPKLTAGEILKNGIKFLPESQQYVKDREPDPEPDFDAVIVFSADTSGSMGPEHRRIEKNLVMNELALLRKKFKKVHVHFVIFDTEGKEVSENEFFSWYLGGGTIVKSGLDKVQEILEKYPKSRYNRFVQLFSDGDDSDPAASSNQIKEMSRDLEYFGYGNISPYGEQWAGQLSRNVEALSIEDGGERLGYASLDSTHFSVIEAIRKFFGKRE